MKFIASKSTMDVPLDTLEVLKDYFIKNVEGLTPNENVFKNQGLVGVGLVNEFINGNITDVIRKSHGDINRSYVIHGDLKLFILQFKHSSDKFLIGYEEGDYDSLMSQNVFIGFSGSREKFKYIVSEFNGLYIDKEFGVSTWDYYQSTGNYVIEINGLQATGHNFTYDKVDNHKFTDHTKNAHAITKEVRVTDKTILPWETSRDYIIRGVDQGWGDYELYVKHVVNSYLSQFTLPLTYDKVYWDIPEHWLKKVGKEKTNKLTSLMSEIKDLFYNK